MGKRAKRIIANNKKARHDFFIEQSYEVGIVLTGTEIKSIRAGRVSIKESFCKIARSGELMIIGMHISPYEQGNRFNVEPLRERKLLMHKREINKLIGTLKTSGLTLVPLTVYLNEAGLCKLEIGLAKGKKNYDKREVIAKKDAERKMDRAIKGLQR
ncbi:MAG: SsrA-binding protein SmpB [Clostridiales bacterium]|nr:SsrA-binding protein SmpB [Clostridiales bacterium]